MLKRWYTGIANICAKYMLLVLVQDKGSEYNSEEMMQFIGSKGIRSYFCPPKEKW